MKWTTTLDINKAQSTTNVTMRKHWTERNGVMGSIKADFKWLTSEAGNRSPRFMEPVTIEVRTEFRRTGQAKLPDTDSAYMAAKAAVDGLVLARTLQGDTPAHILWIRHHAPVWSPTGRDAITLTVETP
jgi:hypothetical protein